MRKTVRRKHYGSQDRKIERDKEEKKDLSDAAEK